MRFDCSWPLAGDEQGLGVDLVRHGVGLGLGQHILQSQLPFAIFANHAQLADHSLVRCHSGTIGSRRIAIEPYFSPYKIHAIFEASAENPNGLETTVALSFSSVAI